MLTTDIEWYQVKLLLDTNARQTLDGARLGYSYILTLATDIEWYQVKLLLDTNARQILDGTSLHKMGSV